MEINKKPFWGTFFSSRYLLILLLVILFLLPTLDTARESCKDLTSFTSSFQESSCTYLIEKKPVSNSTLLAFTQMFILIILASSWNLT